MMEESYGWKPEEIKSTHNERKDILANTFEDPDKWLGVAAKGKYNPLRAVSAFTEKVGLGNFERLTPDTSRVLMFGKIKRENLIAATKIREGMKEKKSADKIADEIAKSVANAKDEDETSTGQKESTSKTPEDKSEGGGSDKGAME